MCVYLIAAVELKYVFLVVPDPTPPSRPLPLPPKEERKPSTPPVSSSHLQPHHRQGHHSQQPPQQPPRNSQLFKQAARKPEVTHCNPTFYLYFRFGPERKTFR